MPNTKKASRSKTLSPEEAAAKAEERKRKTRKRVAAYRARQRAAKGAAPSRDKIKAIDQVDEANRNLISDYLNARSSRLGEATQEAYETDLALFALELAGSSLLHATHTEIGTWLGANIKDPKNPDDKRPWTARTAKRKLAALQGFYTWAVRTKLIEGNPAAGVEVEPVEKEEPHRIASIYIQRLLAYVEDQIALRDDRTHALYVLDALILRLAYHFGLRISEATRIRLSRITRTENELLVSIVKKGNKTKTYPLTGFVLGAYERWMNIRADITIEPNHADFLTVHPWHGKRVSRQRAWRRIQRLGQKAGLPREVIQKLSPHKLRHAIAYDMIDAGYTVEEVRLLLDHANINTTQIYFQSAERERLAIARKTSRHQPKPKQ